MRVIKRVQGTIKPCKRNDGCGVCFGDNSLKGCKSWHGEVRWGDQGKLVYFQCDHGISYESPGEREARTKREQLEREQLESKQLEMEQPEAEKTEKKT